ncbi:MAG: zinc/iron permease [Acidimicrobiia bacterium]|nr:zinc/iron permease [Acidimicrobiia bacterium]
MSNEKLFILGALAGLTIFVGLPVGRIRHAMPRTRAFLNATAIGVLVFLLFDVLSHANEPVEGALTAAHDGSGSWGRFVWLAALFAVGIGTGLLSLEYYDRWLRRHASRARSVGAAAVEDLAVTGRYGWTPAHRLAFFIALGIGLHNFSEGLAIGQSAAGGEVSLASVLIIGFALHNGTEGFGIIAPFAGGDERPSWGFLGAMGLIGGGPTFLGTLIGHSVVNDSLFLIFLALAAGSILYVIVQLLKAAQKLGYSEVLMWGLLLGISAGFATDYVLVVAGG